MLGRGSAPMEAVLSIGPYDAEQAAGVDCSSSVPVFCAGAETQGQAQDGRESLLQFRAARASRGTGRPWGAQKRYAGTADSLAAPSRRLFTHGGGAPDRTRRSSESGSSRGAAAAAMAPTPASRAARRRPWPADVPSGGRRVAGLRRKPRPWSFEGHDVRVNVVGPVRRLARGRGAVARSIVRRRPSTTSSCRGPS